MLQGFASGVAVSVEEQHTLLSKLQNMDFFAKIYGILEYNQITILVNVSP